MAEILHDRGRRILDCLSTGPLTDLQLFQGPCFLRRVQVPQMCVDEIDTLKDHQNLRVEQQVIGCL